VTLKVQQTAPSDTGKFGEFYLPQGCFTIEKSGNIIELRLKMSRCTLIPPFTVHFEVTHFYHAGSQVALQFD
jgi:hypothetical protein